MFAEIDGIRVHYEISGEGVPVLLLHGWGCSTKTMEPVANFLSNGYKAISIDFPGHGETPEPRTPWSVAEYAHLTKKLIQTLGIAPCHVIAHSFGCRVAIYMASEWPELFGKLLLTGAAGLIPKRTLKYYLRVYAYKLAKRLAKIGFLDRMLGISERAKNAGSPDYRALSDNMKGTFVRVVNQNLFDRLKHVRSETLLLWGNEDTETPLEFGRIMEREIPDSALVIFEGSGHYAFLEQFPRFCAVCKYFLEGAS
ncbi:MAG: alpha/beta fold hydrolase [Christensenellales bacterium]|jgi:pimeloyl-ACP methyl ester carboxylesterase